MFFQKYTFGLVMPESGLLLFFKATDNVNNVKIYKSLLKATPKLSDITLSLRFGTLVVI